MAVTTQLELDAGGRRGVARFNNIRYHVTMASEYHSSAQRQQFHSIRRVLFASV